VAKAMSTMSSSTVRGESEVTAIEYNRWKNQDRCQTMAEERKQQHENERALRKELQDRYMAHGADHRSEFKEQMEAAKQEVRNLQQHNASKGAEVKSELDSLAKARKKQRDQWQEHGSTLAKELGSEQKRKIKSTMNALSTRNHEKSQAIRSELSELEKAHAELKAQAVNNRKQLRDKVASLTSDAVTQEAKMIFYEQRKAGADETRQQAQKLKQQQKREKSALAEKASTARENAKQAKLAAKASLEGLRAKNAQAAKEIKQRRQNVEAAGGKFKSEITRNNKIVHDMLKKQKFVSPTRAEDMKAKATNFSELTRSSPSAATGSAAAPVSPA